MSITLFKVLMTLVVFLLTRYASRNRNSKFTSIFFGRNGPVPQDFEPKYRYFFRWALYSLSWSVILIYGYYFCIVEMKVEIFQDEHVIITAIFAMGLPLLIGTAVFAFLGSSVRALWAYCFNRTELLMEDPDNLKI